MVDYKRAKRVENFIGNNPNSERKDIIKYFYSKNNREEYKLYIPAVSIDRILKYLIKEKIIRKRAKRYILTEEVNYNFLIQTFKNIIYSSFNVETEQKSEYTKDLVISDEKNKELKDSITEILYNCIIMNPDNWLVFQELKDFNFSIKITSELHKVPNLMDYYLEIRNYMRNNNDSLRLLSDKQLYDLAEKQLKRRQFK